MDLQEYHYFGIQDRPPSKNSLCLAIVSQNMSKQHFIKNKAGVWDYGVPKIDDGSEICFDNVWL
jgi:hypothetical protein